MLLMSILCDYVFQIVFTQNKNFRKERRIISNVGIEGKTSYFKIRVWTSVREDEKTLKEFCGSNLDRRN